MNHGEQWGALFDHRTDLMPLLQRILEHGTLVAEGDGLLPNEGGVGRTESGFALAYPNTPLRYVALCMKNSHGRSVTREFQTALPWCAEGFTSELEVVEVVPDPDDPLEGGVQFEGPDGALLWAVDPLFFKHRNSYTPGRSLNVSLAGLAFTVAAAAPSMDVTAEAFVALERQRLLKLDPAADVSKLSSVRVQLTGARSLFPHDTLPFLASRFRAPVDKVEQFWVEDLEVYRIQIAPIGDQTSQRVPLWLYATLRALGDYRPRVGDDIEGVASLQATPVA